MDSTLAQPAYASREFFHREADRNCLFSPLDGGDFCIKPCYVRYDERFHNAYIVALSNHQVSFDAIPPWYYSAELIELAMDHNPVEVLFGNRLVTKYLTEKMCIRAVKFDAGLICYVPKELRTHAVLAELLKWGGYKIEHFEPEERTKELWDIAVANGYDCEDPSNLPMYDCTTAF